MKKKDKTNEEVQRFERTPKSDQESESKQNKQKTRSQLLNLEKYMQETYQWLSEIASLMKTEDRYDWAFNALRGVLHALRDRVPPEEVHHLSAQLPMLIRGVYFEGYTLVEKPEKFNREELLLRIEMQMGPGLDGSAERAFKSVLLVLYDHISEGEMEDIYGSLPKDIKQLWSESIRTYSV